VSGFHKAGFSYGFRPFLVFPAALALLVMGHL
jgi:hypothetical protein